MIQKTINRLLAHRHFWRDVGFDELSELYTSVLLRTLAVSLLMVFVPFYLYQNAYTVPAIFMVYGFFFMGRIMGDISAGYFVARFGPKHAMIVSCILQITSAAMFLSIPVFHWPVVLLGMIWGVSASFYFIAYHVEFSKIRHTKHAGRELGYMNIMEKIGAILGPLAGGLVGTLFGPKYIFLVASFALFLSLWPLFRTAEPVKTHQTLRFTDLPVARIKRDLISYCGLGLENTICINLWPLYLALFALGGSVYVQLGALTSVSVVVSIFSAYMIGQHIDMNSGRQILRITAAANAILTIFRPFVGNAGSALAVNVANEAVTVGYRMPYMKGMYAAADDLPGLRIVYLVSMEVIGNIAKGTVWFMLAILAMGIGPRTAMTVGFAIAMVASLVVMTETFKALKPRDIIKHHEQKIPAPSLG